jgi:4'-phosphopantetheinyl transferase
MHEGSALGRDLGAPRCEVWQARPSSRFADALTAAERARHDRLRRDADRDRFATGRALARNALAAELGLDPDAVRLRAQCPTCGGPHGKPSLPGAPADLDFSIAHAGDRVLVAVARGAPVGIDVEQVGETGDLAAEQAGVLTRAERDVLGATPADLRAAAFFAYWTRKEAVLKALGTGLLTPMAELQVSAPQQAPRVEAWPGATDGHAWMQDIDAGPGYAAAVALLTERTVLLSSHPAPPSSLR